jgi:hypothetical protein
VLSQQGRSDNTNKGELGDDVVVGACSNYLHR